MKQFRNLRTVFQVAELLVGALVFGVVTLANPVLAAEKQPAAQSMGQPTASAIHQQQTQTAAKPCKVPQLKNPSGFFTNLRAVNLYFAFSPDLKEALECHGREAECAKRDVMGENGDPAGHAKNIIERLQNLSNNYPQQLYPDQLARSFRPMVKKVFAVALPPDNACQVPEPTMLNPYLANNYAATAGSPDVLNLTIGVTLVATTKPHIVILTRIVFRRNSSGPDTPLLPYSTAIPLDLPEDQISERILEFERTVESYFPTHPAVE